MWKVYRAELRDSWVSWASVSFTFIVANATLALLCLAANSGITAQQTGLVDETSSTLFTAVPVLMIICVALVAAPVIGSATGLVVDARRGAVARLALAGATPGQVRRNIAVQLTIVSLACAVIGDLIGVVTVQPYLDILRSDTNSRNPGMTPLAWIPAVVEAQPLLLANLICLGVALLGGRKRAREASLIPPVEALRQAASASGPVRLGVGRIVLASALGLLLVALCASLPAQVQNRYKETVSNITMEAFLLIFVTGALLAVLAPVLVRPVTAFWTRLLPVHEPAWLLARSTVTARADRLFKSVVPIMLTIGIAVGELTLAASLVGMFIAMGLGDMGEGLTLASLLIVFGMPLAVALAGGLGVLLMMGRQRDADLALAGIAGATPAQRLWLPILEALIIVGTGTLLALVMAGVPLAFMTAGLVALGHPFEVLVPWLSVLAVVALCAVITVAATLLPTLPSRRLPEPRVIARLIAD